MDELTNSIELSLVAPCFNEEDNIEILSQRFLASMSEAEISAEIVFVDDGSTDRTRAILQELSDADPKIRYQVHDTNRGIAAGWKTGIDASRGRLVCLIDSDLQNPPEDVLKLYFKKIRTNCDLVQGVRVPQSKQSVGRWISSRGLNFVLNATFGMNSRDNKSGFVLAGRDALLRIIAHKSEYRHFQTFIAVSAKSHGFSICEVETHFMNRVNGRSYLTGRTMRTILEALVDVRRAKQEFLSKRGPVMNGNSFQRLRFKAYFRTMWTHAWLLRGKPTMSTYLQLKSTEYSSREQLTKIQSVQLHEIIRHHYETTPWFREQMKNLKLTPHNFTEIGDIRQLPLLEKSTITANLESGMISSSVPARHLHRISTSGSTGKPFTIYADREQLEFRFAATLRAMEMTGWRFGDRQARLWHQKIGMTRSQVIRERIDAWFHRRIFIPAFEMDRKSLKKFVERIENHRPVLIDGYAESLNFLASYLRENKVSAIRPKAVISSAQMLPDSTRSTIEKVLNTKVFDKYGSREFSGIAWQCHVGQGHHVTEESYYVELITDGRPSRPGELGEVVITDLRNKAMPMFRYRIGDLATEVVDPYSCSCGRTSRLIGRIEGRTQSIVRCTNGRWLPGSLFLHYFKDFENIIGQFQIHQSTPDGFKLCVVKGVLFDETQFDRVLGGLRDFVGDTPIEIEFVDEIPLVRTGKRSPIVSTLEYDFQDLN